MARIACDLSDILDATKAKLVAAGVFTDKQLFLTVEPDEILVAAKPEPPVAGLTFIAFDQRLDTYQCEMGEEDAPIVEGELIVAIWMRSGTDQPARDQSFLTNVSTGASQLLRKVWSALNNADLENSDGDTLLWRTFNYLGVRQRGRWATDKRWRRMDARFNCCFAWVPDLPLSGLLWMDGSNNVILAADSITLEA